MHYIDVSNVADPFFKIIGRWLTHSGQEIVPELAPVRHSAAITEKPSRGNDMQVLDTEARPTTAGPNFCWFPNDCFILFDVSWCFIGILGILKAYRFSESILFNSLIPNCLIVSICGTRCIVWRSLVTATNLFVWSFDWVVTLPFHEKF